MIAENTQTDSTRKPRHVELAAMLNRDPHVALPRTAPIEAADRLFGLAIAGASALQLPSACGDVEYRDGYARRKLATFDFRELEHLIAAARARLAELDRVIAPLAAEQMLLASLLSPATYERTASPAPNDDDARDDEAPIAAETPERSPLGTDRQRPTAMKRRTDND